MAGVLKLAFQSKYTFYFDPAVELTKRVALNGTNGAFSFCIVSNFSRYSV